MHKKVAAVIKVV